MKAERFEEIFDLVVGQARAVLVQKRGEYAGDANVLHNFEASSAFLGGTQEQALLGFLTKHLISISDMVRTGDTYTPERWDEKIGDAINYLILLRAVVYAGDPLEGFDHNEIHIPSITPTLNTTTD